MKNLKNFTVLLLLLFLTSLPTSLPLNHISPASDYAEGWKESGDVPGRACSTMIIWATWAPEALRSVCPVSSLNPWRMLLQHFPTVLGPRRRVVLTPGRKRTDVVHREEWSPPLVFSKTT